MSATPGHRGWGHIRRLPSKRFQASYHHQGGRHKAAMTFTARIDAEGWLSNERRLIELGTWTPPAVRAAAKKAEVLTLNKFGSRWIAERPLKPRTRQEYLKLWKGPIAPLVDYALGGITTEVVRSWFSGLNASTPNQNSKAYSLLHSVFSTAVLDGLLVSNPCQIKGAMNTKRVREPVILNVDEIGLLAAAMPEHIRALPLISAWCGLRWGEVIELRRKDFDAGIETICVARAVTHEGGCRIDTTKSGRVRNVVIPPHIRADIKHHLDNYVGAQPDSLLFVPSKGGCHLNDSVFMRSYFRPALKSIGRQGVRIHDLRHFTGTTTARVANLRETMDRLGHSTVNASMRYQQIANGRDVEVAYALSALVGNA